MARRNRIPAFDAPLRGHVIRLTRTNGKLAEVTIEEIVSYKKVRWGPGNTQQATLVLLQAGFFMVTQTPKTIKDMIETAGEA